MFFSCLNSQGHYTGACVVALGQEIAAVMSNDIQLRDKIVAIGDETYERCWPLPLPDDYKELIKSNVADIQNISSKRFGGTITAALFLSEFTANSDWAHIDIAGPSFFDKASSYNVAGATGFGVRLLAKLIEKMNIFSSQTE